MEIFDKVALRRTPMKSKEFIQTAEELYQYYKNINDKVTQEYIAVNIVGLLDTNKLRKNLIVKDVDQNKVEFYKNESQNLISRRLVIQTGQVGLVSLIISILAFFLVNNFLKLSNVISLIISILVFFLVLYKLFSNNSKRLIANSKKLYDLKVDNRIIEFFKFYLN